MADTIINPGVQAQPEPELRRMEREPQGVLQKYLKPMMYLGAVGLVLLATVVSGTGKKTPQQQAASNHLAPQPSLQDNTDNNVEELRNFERQKQAEQQDPALANATPAQQAAAAGYGPTGQAVPCAPGQSCTQQPAGQQLSPAQQEGQQLAAKERELAFTSRFASNLVYAHSPEAPAQRQSLGASESAVAAGFQENPNAISPNQPGSSMIAPRAAGDPPPASPAQDSSKHGPQVNIDSAVGQPYVIYEGLTMDTVLMNRLDGDAVGPVKVLVSNPVYSHDRQHVLIPEGTYVLGEARKIGSSGFGQQRRMAVVFHRMIMPDGYSVDLDQFHGLDQIGQQGLKDKVDNHYLQIFGASIALGVISGASEIEQGGGVISSNGSQAFTTGAAGNVSQSASSILDRFIQIPPTITIHEGHRVKVYFTQDMLLPAYENHTISQSF
jgi:type IV secretion system protein VirB10